jgi:hypothetical protein
VDGGKREPYPQNFVCIIPSSRTALLNDSPCCEKLGEECLTVAQQLLTEAATNETDPVIVKEIKRRLKKLEK